MSGRLCSELAGRLCNYMDEIGYVCYDKAHISIHSMVLHYIDEDGDMTVL